MKTHQVVERLKFGMIVGAVVLFLGVFFPHQPTKASGTTLYVGPGQPYEKIQDAITAAAPGDTVFVFEGLYSERLVITKDLTLTGENRETTVITYGAGGHIVEIKGTEAASITVHVSGFTIRNAVGQGYDALACSYLRDGSITNMRLSASEQSDGLQLYHCSGITVSNNIILNNKGAGISLTLSTANTIQSNVIQENQKGIHLYLGSNTNVICENTISGNTQYGVYIVQSTGNQLYRNDFTSNGVHAYDPGTNTWYRGSEGNYWDNYNNYDSDGNGIGDVPYSIPGGTNQDMYPLGYFRESTQNPGGSSNQKPIAYQPSITPNPSCYGETILLTGTGADTDGWIVAYHWRSSIDGVLGTGSSLSIKTLSQGIHTIYFKVQDNEGAWSSEKTATLTVNPPQNKAPVARIEYIEPNPGVAGDHITLCGQGVDDDGTIVEWRWISSIDGEIGSQATCMAPALSVGRHTIYFQVRDNEGKWSKQVSTTLTILEQQVSSSQKMYAVAGGPYVGTVGGAVVFNGSQSYHENGTLVDYQWDFGDGSQGAGKICTHIYSAQGEYLVVLTVKDTNGATVCNTTIAMIDAGDTNSQNNAAGSSFFSILPEIPLVVIVGVPLGVIAGVVVVVLYLCKKR
ncbi:MAG: PKD domain-containing protein [Candidatus Thermoplasmatota archaeon]